MVRTEIFKHEKEFGLELGGYLPGIEISYSTLGKLNKDASNAIWVCHALTGNSNVLDWWAGLFNEAPFDSRDNFVICANMIGGCYGSTGPLSINPESQKPYYHDFPKLTNRDIVRAFDLLRVHLGIDQIHTVIGGSMGGQQALEWAIEDPGVFSNLVGLATNAVHSPWGIAFNESQRMAIANDPTWSMNDANAGIEGLKTARAIGMLSYRCYDIYQAKQQDEEPITRGYRASSYQQYQGEKLAGRFNAFTYWRLSEAMDSHHLGRNRGGLMQALKQIDAQCHFIGIDTDLLFPTREQKFLAENIGLATFDLITSEYGHDGFLVETEKIKQVLKKRMT